MTGTLYLQKQKNVRSKGFIDVPLWALSHLGKEVKLLSDWHTPTRVFSAGDVATLDGITHCKDGNRALLQFDADDPGYLEDVPFQCIEAPPIPLDLVRSLPGRAGDLVFMWMHGVDLRKHLPRSTFYRFRQELKAYSINISKPFVSAKPA